MAYFVFWILKIFGQNEICNPWNKILENGMYLRWRKNWCKTCLTSVAFPFFLVSLRQEFQTWIVKKTHWSLETFVFAKSFSIFLDECYKKVHIIWTINFKQKYIWKSFMYSLLSATGKSWNSWRILRNGLRGLKWQRKRCLVEIIILRSDSNLRKNNTQKGSTQMLSPKI